jgi:hypothetical protein
MTKDEALRLALRAMVVNNQAWKHLADSGDAGYWEAEEQGYYQLNEQAIKAVESALEAKDEPVAFENWLSRTCPSGDAESVQRQWESSNDYADLYTTPPQRKPLTDEEIQGVVNNACLAGTLSWMGYKADDEGKYTIPVLSPSNYQFARAIEAAHGIKGEA